MSTAVTTSNTTAITKWSDEIARNVTERILAGGSVPKEIALMAPKGFISGLRNQRRNKIESESARLSGEIAQQGWKLRDMKEIRTNKTTGVQTMTVTYIKRPDVMVEFASKLGVDVEALRNAINGLAAKK